MLLTTPISQITAVGKRIAPALKKLGLVTARDLLLYWPFRYEDWSDVSNIEDLHVGAKATVNGIVHEIKTIYLKGNKRVLVEAVIADKTGTIRAVWFNQKYIGRNVKIGDTLFLSGTIELGPHGFQITQPTYEKLSSRKDTPTHTARIVPVYSLTKSVTQKQLRYLISQVLPLYVQIKEWLPRDLLDKYDLLPLSEAIHSVHFPKSQDHLDSAKHRLKFDELFLVQLRGQVARLLMHTQSAPQLTFHLDKTKEFLNSLPFTLTQAQKKSAWEIIQNMEKDYPMNRLLEGDVGSGKTLVATLAVLNTMLNHYQTAYMAPTSILAIQQYETFCKYLEPYGASIALLTGNKKILNTDLSLKGTEVKKEIADGKVDVVVGTQAVVQSTVSFKKLGLAIIDEQHRFGVSQRSMITKLQQGDIHPHFLSMTATPIPRSLALTLYGDLDLSIINQLPEGRKPIKTKLVPPDKRGEQYTFVKEEVSRGRQVFVVCPLIDPSDTLGKRAATEEFNKLSNEIFPDLSIGLMHGKLSAKEKDDVIKDFADKKYDILVSTAVIEVGIDIPNASIIMIESAERFGLAQLHQFRGRVGRGKHQSYCLLLTESEEKSSIKRLQTLVECNDGFTLAERDLEFRGPGDIYGIKQHGFDDMLHVAKLTDYIVIKESQDAVSAVLYTSPDLSKFPLVKRRLDEFEQAVHFE